jgi:hypothetical protein
MRLMETLPLPEEKRAELRQRLERGSAPFKPGLGTEVTKPGVILEGHFVEHSSLARINREIGTSLMQNSEIEGALEPSTYGCIVPQAVAGGDLIQQGMNRHPPQPSPGGVRPSLCSCWRQQESPWCRLGIAR